MRTFWGTQFNTRLFGLAAMAALMTAAAGTATASLLDLNASA